MKPTNYFFLAGLFFVVFLVFEFTDIYGVPGWVKVFVLILATTFLWSGIAVKRKKDNESDQTKNK